jgi:hypothetical protein
MSAAPNRPPLTREPIAAHVFRTEGLDLSAALMASRALAYAGAEPVGDGRVVFRFLDPENRGAQLEVDYATGQLPKVDAMVLFRCKVILQDTLREVLNRGTGGRIGNGNR